MTKERLESYRSKVAEIRELKHKLRHLGEDDSMIGNDTIMDYRTGFPKPQSVVGFDQEKYNSKRESYQSLLDRLSKECAEVEEWINQLPDGNEIRRIFRMRYIDGMTQKKVGKAVHMSQSVISEKISNFLNSDKTDKKVRYNQK